MNIDFEGLAALFHDELHKTFSVRFQWYTCSSMFQQIWEQAMLHVDWVSADRPYVPPPRFVSGKGEPPPRSNSGDEQPRPT